MRLKNEHRHDILHRFQTDKFQPQEKTLKEQYQIEALNAYLGKHKKTFDSLPPDYFHQRGLIALSCLNQSYSLVTPIRVPQSVAYSPIPVSSKALKLKAEKFHENMKVFREQTNKDLTTIRALLKSVTTLKRLQQLWPEGAKYYKFLEDQTIQNPMIVRMEEINERYELP